MFDQRKVSSIPEPDERDLYRRWWLPGLTKKEEMSVRRHLTKVKGLSDYQVDRLLVEYAADQIGAYPDSPRLPHSERRDRGRDWSRWAVKTVAIDVDLKRGGRVILREPHVPYRVELYFVELLSSKAGERGFLFKRVELLPERATTLMGSAPDLRCYWAAFIVRMTKETSGPMLDGSVPLIGPASGKPFDVDWYMSLIDAETALKEQGHPAPAKELAERYGVKYATMRSYLSRGHKRLKE